MSRYWLNSSPSPRAGLQNEHNGVKQRLHGNGRLSKREIAHAIGISRSTVSEYLRGAQAAGLGWPLLSISVEI
ncbi:winged helix-turn-helix domain-containing protein [Acidithiobacillus caldus ATCC 51756]|nr:winged helix-turn-helix domain-containing protein [Acidithiobacillus caldus]MBU2737011.1 winged helix-turn-helix domain-containing protein [Acidithiobacillus caldus ATCC 51756]MBU2743724.1 winged helix-turn-helix domain-containing protein [Acidithiobacillus caldus]MBU2764311.1 winged helix-turn-helix domain-containing protein [Acidithiobacillus caldus]MBU2771637.1 winged helix-turn-helix domain-containing protein [Acidithiobacillus caldus]